MDYYEKLIDELEAELRKSIGETPSLAKSEDESEEVVAEEASEDKEESKDGSEEDKDYSEEDLEELEKMYDSMKQGEHKHHLKALKKAMTKCWKAEDMDSCWSEQDAKEEDKKEEKEEDKKEEMEKCGDVMAKSESSNVELLKKENEDLKKNLEGLVSAMTTFVAKAPARKAITDVSLIKKSEVESTKNLSKSEITKILTKKAQDPSLSKTDRDAINAFYFNQAGLDAIKHLLS